MATNMKYKKKNSNNNNKKNNIPSALLLSSVVDLLSSWVTPVDANSTNKGLTEGINISL